MRGAFSSHTGDDVYTNYSDSVNGYDICRYNGVFYIMTNPERHEGTFSKNYYRLNIQNESWDTLKLDTEISKRFPNTWKAGNYYFIGKNEVIFQYDPQSNRIYQVNILLEIVFLHGLMEVINEEVYIGVMYSEETIYKLDFSLNTLSSKYSFPGNVFEQTILSFATNESIYILRAPFSLATLVFGNLSLRSSTINF
jgi:hypothetical protein